MLLIYSLLSLSLLASNVALIISIRFGDSSLPRAENSVSLTSLNFQSSLTGFML